MWVPRIPKRFDFCGCPPCGLCFNWVDDQPAPKIVRQEDPIEEVQPALIDGMDKLAQDLIGKPLEECDTPEVDSLTLAAQEIHERNINRKINPPKEPEGGMTFQEADEKYWFNKQLNRDAAARRREQAYQEELKKPKSLDAMDWGASEEAKELQSSEEEKKKEKLKKAAEEAAKKEAAKPSRAEQRARELEAIQRLQQRAGSYDPWTDTFRFSK